jgi:hypothetical protein
MKDNVIIGTMLCEYRDTYKLSEKVFQKLMQIYTC